MEGPEHREFPRQNPWAVFGLLVLTFGVYGAVWIRDRARLFNERLPSHPISARFTGTLLTVCVADLGFFLASLVAPQGTFTGVTGPVSGLTTGLLLLGALRVRRRIQYLAEVPGSPLPKVSLLKTILFNVAYLQATLQRYAPVLEAPPSERFERFDRPFRDSHRLAWVASLGLPALASGLVLVIVIGSFAIDWIGTVSFWRAHNRAVERYGPLTDERFSSDETGLHPILEVGGALDPSEEDENRLQALAKKRGPMESFSPEDLRDLEALLEGHRELLERAGLLLQPPGRTLGASYPPHEDAQLPPHLLDLVVLGRLIFLEGRLVLDARGVQAALPSIQHLGILARVLEGEPNEIPLLLGFTIEGMHLRLLADAVGRCPEPTEAAALRASVPDGSMEERLREVLAWHAALLLRFERDQIREYEQEKAQEEENRLLFRGLEPRVARGFVRYSVAGGLDWLARHDDAYHASYRTMRSTLEIDPDELSFLEKVRIVGAITRWRLPAKSRALSDSREGALLALRALEDGAGRDCDELRSRLGPHEELYRVVDGGSAGCVLRYRQAEDFERVARGDLPAPPFEWRLGCT